MLNLLLDNVAAKSPEKLALIFENKTYTYDDLYRLTQSMAGSLLERGINPGDRMSRFCCRMAWK
jgi:acyl-CoA synthetase (AMP-forming)/AMP-acid ligase II